MLTKGWPKEECYGLTNQVHRAATSIPANLAEGIGRGTPNETARFAQIALGSLYELDTLLHLASELRFSSESTVRKLRGELTSLAERTSTFIGYQKRKS